MAPLICSRLVVNAHHESHPADSDTRAAPEWLASSVLEVGSVAWTFGTVC
jgi:hypothetical protein